LVYPSFETIYPQYLMDVAPKRDFSQLGTKLTSKSLLSTFPKDSRKLFSSFANTIMSSMYGKLQCFSSCNTLFIILWKVAGALHSPNGITVNSYSPSWVTKAVLGISSGAILICQYPVF